MLAGGAWASVAIALTWCVASFGRFESEADSLACSFVVFPTFFLGAIPATIGFVLAVAGYLKAEDGQYVLLRRIAIGLGAAYVVPVLLIMAGQ